MNFGDTQTEVGAADRDGPAGGPGSSPESGTVVVVGAGVVGAACAYYLQRSGWRVTVVDQGLWGRACSYANCGFVCPSHVLPLTQPGAVTEGIRALLKPGGPLSIRVRYDPALWSWLMRFARRCNRRDMIAAGHGIAALLNSSRELFDKLLVDEAIQCEWQADGLLVVCAGRTSMQHHAATNDLLSEQFEMPAERFDGDALCQWEPALVSGLAGGWLYRRDAHLRPDLLMREWRRVLASRGAVVRENCKLLSIRRQGNRATAVETSQGELPGDAFVIATGAWTPLLAKELGVRIPIQPGKGYSLTMPRPARCPRIPLVLEEHRVAVTPMRSGYRLGSTMEFAGFDTSIPQSRLELLTTAAQHYLHEPTSEPVQERWYGWRPMTYDGLPIIDRCPAASNVLVAAGHNMLGLSMAPATGRLVAELLGETAPHLDPEPYSLRRF